MADAICVRLAAETRIEDNDGDVQFIRHAGYGMLSVDDDRFTLSYEDHQGNERIRITLEGNGDRVEMHRDGDAKGILTFVPGHETNSVYSLGYGEIDIGIRTISIELQLNEIDGSITLFYESRLGGESANRTRYCCRWKS